MPACCRSFGAIHTSTGSRAPEYGADWTHLWSVYVAERLPARLTTRLRCVRSPAAARAVAPRITSPARSCPPSSPTYFAPDERPLTGAVAGLAGGLAASFAMDLFQKFVPAKRFAKLLGDPAPDGRAEPATEKAAQAISTNVFQHHLAKTEKQAAAPVVHYATGGGIGLVYGLAAEYLPVTTTASACPSAPPCGRSRTKPLCQRSASRSPRRRSRRPRTSTRSPRTSCTGSSPRACAGASAPPSTEARGPLHRPLRPCGTPPPNSGEDRRRSASSA